MGTKIVAMSGIVVKKVESKTKTRSATTQHTRKLPLYQDDYYLSNKSKYEEKKNPNS